MTTAKDSAEFPMYPEPPSERETKLESDLTVTPVRKPVERYLDAKGFPHAFAKQAIATDLVPVLEECSRYFRDYSERRIHSPWQIKECIRRVRLLLDEYEKAER